MRTAWILALATLVAGCGDSEPGVEIEGRDRGGIRVVIPGDYAGTDLRLEVWHDNAVDAPACTARPRDEEGDAPAVFPGGGFAVTAAAAGPDQAACGGMAVEIRDLAGRLVREEPEVPFTLTAYGWDQRDQAGELVQSGFYPTFQWCVDNRDLTFTGIYFVLRDETRFLNRGVCEWPLFLRDVPGDEAAGVHELSPLPVLFNYDLRDTTITTQLIRFRNPYTVRVRAGDDVVFEDDIDLVEGFHTEIRVDAPGGPNEDR